MTILLLSAKPAACHVIFMPSGAFQQNHIITEAMKSPIMPVYHGTIPCLLRVMLA